MRQPFFLLVFIAGALLFCGCETAPLFRGYRFYCRGAYPQSVRAFTYYLNHSRDRKSNVEERAVAFFYRGLAKTEMRESREAIKDYEEALSRDSDFFYASFNMGVEYVRLANYEKALPSFAQSWSSILKAGRGELDKSRLWDRKAFPRDREYAFYYYGMSAVLCGEVKSVRKILEEARSFEFKQGEIVNAKETFSKIVSGEISQAAGRAHVEELLKKINEKERQRKCHTRRQSPPAE